MSMRDLYKTKLCTLFARGNCDRVNCTYAHGEEELRRPPPGYNEAGKKIPAGPPGRYSGQRRSGDIRERLGYFEDERRFSRRRGRSQSISPARDYPERRYYSRSPSESGEDRPRKRDRRTDYDGADLGDHDADRLELEQERKLISKDIAIQQEHLETMRSLMSRKLELASNLEFQMKMLEAELKEKEASLSLLTENLKKVLDTQKEVVAAEENLKRNEQRLQLALAEVNQEDLAFPKFEIPKLLVLEAPIRPSTHGVQKDEAPKSLSPHTSSLEQSRQLAHNRRDERMNSQIPSTTEVHEKDEQRFYMDEGFEEAVQMHKGGRHESSSVALKRDRNTPVPGRINASEPLRNHGPSKGDEPSLGDAGRWYSADEIDEGELEDRALGKGIVLKFREGERKPKRQADAEKEVEPKTKKAAEQSHEGRADVTKRQDNLSLGRPVKDDKPTVLIRRQEHIVIPPRVRITDQAKGFRRSEEKTVDEDPVAEKVGLIEGAKNNTEPLQAVEEEDSAVEFDSAKTPEKKAGTSAEDKAKQEQIHQKQQELMEHIQKQIQERQQEEQLRQQLYQQQLAAEEAERRAMYEAQLQQQQQQEQQQQHQQLEQFYQPTPDQYQMAYADPYMVPPADQYPVEAPEGYGVEEDEPPPGVTFGS